MIISMVREQITQVIAVNKQQWSVIGGVNNISGISIINAPNDIRGVIAKQIQQMIVLIVSKSNVDIKMQM